MSDELIHVSETPSANVLFILRWVSSELLDLEIAAEKQRHRIESAIKILEAANAGQ